MSEGDYSNNIPWRSMSLRALIREMVQRLPRIFLFSLFLSFLSISYGSFLDQPRYEAKGLVMVRRNIDFGDDIRSYTDSPIQIHRLDTFTSILISEAFQSRVLSNLNVSMRIDAFSDNIKILRFKDTPMIQISVLNKEPEEAGRILNRIIDDFILLVEDEARIGFVEVVDRESVSKKPKYPNIELNALVSALAGAVMAFIWVFIQVIKLPSPISEESIVHYVGVPVLGKVPSFQKVHYTENELMFASNIKNNKGENGPLVSVICTVKNGAGTLPASIESVLDQTYENWELIVVNDGSTDRTLEILDAYVRKDSRIRVYDGVIAGRPNVLNQGIELSRGSLVAILDADDAFHPQKLEVEVAAFLEHPTAFLIASQSLIVYDDEVPAWERMESAPEFSSFNDRLLIRNTIIHSSVMMNRAKLIQIGAYDTSRSMQLDYELWLRGLTLGLEMLKLEFPLAAKRIHQNQSFENKKRLRYIWSSAQLQWQYILKNKRYLWIPLPLIAFLYALLPLSIRKKFFRP